MIVPYLLLVFCLVLTGCSNTVQGNSRAQTEVASPTPVSAPRTLVLPSVEQYPEPAHEDVTRLVTSLNTFSLEYLSQAAHGSQAGNVTICPVGVYAVLSVLHHGATEKERMALSQLLGNGWSQPELAYLLWKLNKAPSLAVVQKLFLDTGLKVDETKVEQLDPSLCTVGRVSFTDDFSAGKAAVEEWCKTQTAGLFRGGLPLPDTTRVAVVSTFVFDGTWSHPFEPYYTEARDFFLSSGEIRKVTTMRLEKEELSYYRWEQGEAVVMPHKDGLEMLLVLPRKGAGEMECLQSYLRDKPKAYEDCIVTVELPRWEHSTSSGQLTENLKRMGYSSNQVMLEKFLESSNNQLEFRLFQESQIQVDEYGTEAEAVTVAYGTPAATETPPGVIKFITVKFSRPFAYLIRESGTGAVLFGGIVRDP